MAKVGFKFDKGTLDRGLRTLPPEVERRVHLTVERAAAKGEVYLKNDAPWTDRTGAARSGLHTTTSSSGRQHEIVFAHTVDYGIWLEVKNSGKYEVIVPTMIKTGRELMGDLKGVLG